MLLYQPPQPLRLPLAHVPRPLDLRPARHLLQLPHNLRLGLIVEAAPLLCILPLLLLILDVIQQVVERVVALLAAYDADDLAVGVALDLGFGYDGRVLLDGEGGGGVRVGRGGGGGAGFGDAGFDAAGGTAEAGDEAEAAVVL